MRIVGHGQITPERLEALTSAVAAHRLTEHVIRGLEVLQATLEEVIEQDGFTIDLVVRLPDGLFLVYDTT